MQMFKPSETKRSSGSVLAFALIILSVILVSVLAISAVSVTERKNSLAGNASTQAFQTADTAVELVLKTIRNSKPADINSLASSMNGGSGWSCSGGTLTGVASSTNIIGGSSGSVKMTFNDGTNDLACNGQLSTAVSVKSSGLNGTTTRAITTALAAGLTWNNITTFTSGWASYGSPFFPAQYAIDYSTGLVYLRGLISKPSNSTGDPTVATLPSGFRPQFWVAVASTGYGASGYGPGRVDILPDGSIIPRTNAGIYTQSVYLDGIVFSIY